MTLSKNIIQTFGTKIITIGLSFLSSIFLTRLLGAEGKGVFAYINTNIALFVMLFGFGMARTMTYFLANKEVDREAVIGIGFNVLVVGIIGFSIMISSIFVNDLSLKQFFFPQGYTDLFILVFIIISYIYTISTNYLNGLWQGTFDFKTMNLTTIIVNVVKLIVFFTTWLYVSLIYDFFSIKYTLTLVLLVFGIDLLIKLIFIGKKHTVKISLRHDSILTRSFLRFGSLGIMIGVLHFANKRIDIWFVEHYNGIEQLGYYSLAAGLIDILITLIIPALQVLIPYYSQMNQEERMELLSQVSRIGLVFSFLFLLIFVVVISWLIPILYGQEFTESILPFQILGIGAFFLMVQYIFSTFNVATNNQKVNIYGNVIAVIITLILNIMLVPSIGIIGASISSVCAYFSSGMFIIISVLVKSEISIYNFFVLKSTDVVFLRQYLINNLLQKKRL